MMARTIALALLLFIGGVRIASVADPDICGAFMKRHSLAGLWRVASSESGSRLAGLV